MPSLAFHCSTTGNLFTIISKWCSNTGSLLEFPSLTTAKGMHAATSSWASPSDILVAVRML